MITMFENIEDSAVWLSPLLLMGLGLVVILVGLFIWLGGLGFKKLLVAVAGAVTGFLCGFVIIGLNIIAAAALAAILAFVAIVFERVFITILAAALTAVICFAVVAGPYVEKAKPDLSFVQAPASGENLSVKESIDRLEVFINDTAQKIKNAASQMPLYKWLIIIVPMIISAVIAIYLMRFASALCCSILGTIFLFAGMIILLLHKGSRPLTHIHNKPLFYLGIFAVMAAFGTIEQLIICKRKKKEPAADDKASEGEKSTHRSWLSWRGT